MPAAAAFTEALHALQRVLVALAGPEPRRLAPCEVAPAGLEPRADVLALQPGHATERSRGQHRPDPGQAPDKQARKLGPPRGRVPETVEEDEAPLGPLGARRLVEHVGPARGELALPRLLRGPPLDRLQP